MIEPSGPLPITDRKQALLTLRIIWAAMIAGQIAFLIVVGVMLVQASMTPNPQLGTILFFVGLAMLLTGVPAGYFIRNQVYKSNWQGDVIAPRGYVTGNLILLAICEGVSFLGLVGTLIQGSFGLPIVPSVAALAVQVINFPTGAPMHEARNPYDAGPRPQP